MLSRRLEGPVLRRLEGSKPVLSASKEGEARRALPEERHHPDCPAIRVEIWRKNSPPPLRGGGAGEGDGASGIRRRHPHPSAPRSEGEGEGFDSPEERAGLPS